MNHQHSNSSMPRCSARNEMIKILSSVGESPYKVLSNPALDAVNTDTATQKVESNAHSKSVRFDTVEIRECPYVLGDNPSVSAGPPLSIGWDPQDEFTVGFDEYEAGKPTRPRDIYEMRFDETLRLLILQSSGYMYTIREIAQAAIDVRIIQHHREETAQSSLRAQRLQQTKRLFEASFLDFPSLGARALATRATSANRHHCHCPHLYHLLHPQEKSNHGRHGRSHSSCQQQSRSEQVQHHSNKQELC